MKNKSKKRKFEVRNWLQEAENLDMKVRSSNKIKKSEEISKG